MSASRSGSAAILIASADSVLSDLRKQILEREEGWTVTVSRNKQHALALLHSEPFDLLLLCNSVSHKTRVEFATVYRQHNPLGKVVVVEGRDQSVVAFDAVLQVATTPRELLAILHKLLPAASPTKAND